MGCTDGSFGTIGGPNDFLYYDQGRLVGFLAVFSFQSSEAELTGMVHPDYRRRGIFSGLRQAAIAECSRRDIPNVIYINQRGSASGKAFLMRIEAAYSFSEYVMELAAETKKTYEDSLVLHSIKLRQAGRHDIELLVHLNMQGFGMSESDTREYVLQTMEGGKERTWIAELAESNEPIGKIGAMVEMDGSSFIYGFCVLPEKRGKGYGRQILRETIDLLIKRGQTGATKLEVAVDNEGALGLYESCGFVTVSANDYYLDKSNTTRK
ncbi:GNAT family N-acetyltransferase [Paenibacillus hexagrammi]|uniref:GNAT family N-acetyltransferase n=1 Tax=Paenibacillus hexagrammi TaxID=2908839 RepID=A0ABY3SJM6_9BACL|nr:GNAT family N-acetyltransferase [Paenibacillus sp. YPD9-1]UJF33585.1 GNAT family N-acetyltransferase [Paenibacillus sp. YPD9-1]